MNHAQSLFSLPALSIVALSLFGFVKDQPRTEIVKGAIDEIPALEETSEIALSGTLVISERDAAVMLQGDCWSEVFDEENECHENYWFCDGGSECEILIDHGESNGGKQTLTFECSDPVTVTNCGGLWTIHLP